MLEEEKKEKKKIKAKDVSKWSMIVASLWISVLSLVKAFWTLFAPEYSTFGLEMTEILASGIVLAAVFTPVYISIILDKVKDIKIGG